MYIEPHYVAIVADFPRCRSECVTFPSLHTHPTSYFLTHDPSSAVQHTPYSPLPANPGLPSLACQPLICQPRFGSTTMLVYRGRIERGDGRSRGDFHVAIE